jgi:Flp pilus assembly secretin CpaC
MVTRSLIVLGLALVVGRTAVGAEPLHACTPAVNGRQELARDMAIAWLEKTIKGTVPDSEVVPIPGPGNSIILKGRASSAAAAQCVFALAKDVRSVYRGEVVDAMVVAAAPAVEPIQIDLTILNVSPSKLRKADPKLVDRWQQMCSSGDDRIPSAQIIFVSKNSAEVLEAIEGLRKCGAAKLLAEPRIVTLNGRPACFLSGGQHAVYSQSADGEKLVRFIPIGTQLKLLPRIVESGKVFLEVEAELSSPVADNVVETEDGPVAGRRTRRVHFSSELESGELLGLRGMKESQLECIEKPVPVLSALPFGQLFTIKEYREDEEELVVLTKVTRMEPARCGSAAVKPPNAN